METMYHRLLIGLVLLLSALVQTARAEVRPNILLVIADDQSYPHASAYGCGFVSTPGFDRIAREGVLFTNAFAASPGCSPSRASILTGRYPWQNAHAGTHASSFSSRLTTYPQLLATAGYKTGFAGKGWGPGNFTIGGFSENPAGRDYSLAAPHEVPPGISNVDYAASFANFLNDRTADQPFCFWCGPHEPHRRFEPGIGQRHGGDLAQIQVPKFLPDTAEVRSDLLDYAFEIEWFDAHVMRMLKELESRGLLDNTIVVVTSDNGMAFPRAKANCYESGIHMPLAVRWGSQIPAGRMSADLVSLIDLMPTFLEAAAVSHPQPSEISGHSLLPLLKSIPNGSNGDPLRSSPPKRDAVFAARERHSSSRWNNVGYPQRAIRTNKYLYIRNFHPERLPAGAPELLAAADATNANVSTKPATAFQGYYDIDASPSLTYLVEHRNDSPVGAHLYLATGYRPAEELYDIESDPDCLINLAGDATHESQRKLLSERLLAYMQATQDPHASDDEQTAEVFEAYARYSPLRTFAEPDWSLARKVAVANATTKPDNAYNSADKTSREALYPLASRWAKEMQAFAQNDVMSPPTRHEIVFVGSSSIRLWDVARWFPDHKILNRGFGGSILADANHYFDLLVSQHQPRMVVLYAGDNDIALGLTPAQVTADFRQFVQRLHTRQPQAELAYIAIKPSIKRWQLIETIRAANQAIREICEADPLCNYVDVDAPMLGSDGQPRPELFVDDGLHMTNKGYALWTQLLMPLLAAEDGAPAATR